MAGHILLGLLAAAYCGILMGLGSSWLIILSFTVVVLILLLFELFVSFLQTYVFVVLLCSYYNDIYCHFR
jgi:F0F1-type ATP synthase membrane subunit a